MERPLKGRAHTFTGAVASLFSKFKTTPVSPSPNETIGWRPNTLKRNTSELSEHHVLGCKPIIPSKAAPTLKRQLSSGSSKQNDTAPRDIPKVGVVEVTSPGAQSYASSSSSQRVAFVSEPLKPADASKSVSKLRQRAPSPYPDAKKLPPTTKQKAAVHCEPLIRNRTRTLTMERMDGVHSITRYLEAHPDALPPPGSTPAFVEQYWNLQRCHSGESVLSNPEADDNASDVGDAESNTSFGSEDIDDDPCRVSDCETAYDSEEDGCELKPAPRRQYTPAATRPPLIRNARTWPQGMAPDHDDSDPDDSTTQAASRFLSDDLLNPSECHLSTTLCGSASDAPAIKYRRSPEPEPTYTADSWLPTDPSALSALKMLRPRRDIPLPRLRWGRDISPDGLWFISSVRPSHGATAGGPDGAGGPSHTPRPGCFHSSRDSRFGPIDAEELAERLEFIAERLEFGDYRRRRGQSVGSAYDEQQERIRDKYKAWEGGVGRTEWMGSQGGEWNRVAAAAKDPHPGVGLEHDGEAEAVECVEDFPDYQDAEEAFAEGRNNNAVGDTDAADPSKRGHTTRLRRTSNLPTSKAHRQRAASRLDAAAAAPAASDLEMHLQSMVEATRALMDQAEALVVA